MIIKVEVLSDELCSLFVVVEQNRPRISESFVHFRRHFFSNYPVLSKLCIIDLHALSDAIFFGLGNLELKIVAMSYEMSL